MRLSTGQSTGWMSRFRPNATKRARIRNSHPDTPTYVRHAADRRSALVNDKAALGEEIGRARDSLAEAFEEQKKYEITAENLAEAEAAEANRREQGELDALGLQAHTRSGAE